jgi:hypothetical protein
MTREEAYLKQDVISSDPQDAIEPRGFIFALRGDNARVVFADNAMRDVPLASLTSAEPVEPPKPMTKKAIHTALAEARKTRKPVQAGTWSLSVETVNTFVPGVRHTVYPTKVYYYATTADGYRFGGYDRIDSFASYLASGRAPIVKPQSANA